MFRDKTKKSKGMIIGMVVLALIAVGGIGFGVWAFLSGNQKEVKLNEQISDLQSQLASQPEINETTTEVDGYANPIIKATKSRRVRERFFVSSAPQRSPIG